MNRIINKLYPVSKTIHNSSRLIQTSAVKFEDVKIEKSINQVMLLGRVGNDPQKKGTEEHPVVTFSLATHNNYRYESGDLLQKTDWHRVSVFKPNLRETVLSYMKKGQRIHVSGRLSYGEMKAEDGQMKPTCNVIADDVIFLQG